MCEGARTRGVQVKRIRLKARWPSSVGRWMSQRRQSCRRPTPAEDWEARFDEGDRIRGNRERDRPAAGRVVATEERHQCRTMPPSEGDTGAIFGGDRSQPRKGMAELTSIRRLLSREKSKSLLLLPKGATAAAPSHRDGGLPAGTKALLAAAVERKGREVFEWTTTLLSTARSLREVPRVCDSRSEEGRSEQVSSTCAHHFSQCCGGSAHSMRCSISRPPSLFHPVPPISH